MPGEIGKLAAGMLKDPAHVAVAPVATTAERVEQADRDRDVERQLLRLARRRTGALLDLERVALRR